MYAVEAGGTIVCHFAQRPLGDPVEEPADHVAGGVAAEGVRAEEADIHRKNESPEPDAERDMARCISEPERFPDIVQQQDKK